MGISDLKKEDKAQREDAKFFAFTRGAKYFEYTDKNGKVIKGETGRETGGTYRAIYSEDVANYAKMSTSALESERTRIKGISDSNYQGFARSAASKSASQVKAFSDADTKIKIINQVLRRRKKNK